MPYLDFTITVRDERSVAIAYEDSRGTRHRIGRLIPDPIAQFTVTRMNAWVNYGLAISQTYNRDDLNPEDLKAIGLNLYRILFGDPEVEMRFRDQYDDLSDDSAKGKSLLDRRMRLRLVFEDAAGELRDLPWELLFIPKSRMSEQVIGKGLPEGSFFGQKDYLLLTRYSPLPGDTGQPFEAESEPLKILVATYVNFPTLNVIRPEEIEIVKSAMRKIPGATMLDDVRDLPYREFKERISTDRPDIVHFIGHGEAGTITLVYGEGDKGFDERRINERQVRWFPGDQLPLLFERHKPRLVFLQACNGSASPANGLSSAQGLIRCGIPAVIAMQYSIRAYDASNFARVFYENIAKGIDVDEAVRVGRHELGDPEYDHPRFGTPVIYLRTEERLFKEISPQPKLPQRTEKSISPSPQPSPARAAGAAPAAMAATPVAEKPSEPGSQSQRTA